jgi:ketosteroid isomerase-like protein
VPTTLDAKLRDVQALLNTILEEAHGGGGDAPSHWELPILPPPDADGQLSSTDLLNWWFRAPQSRTGDWEKAGDWGKPGDWGNGVQPSGDKAPRLPAEWSGQTPAAGRDAWTDLSMVFPEPEEHLAEEHAQSAVDCLYDFLHAIGERDVEAAALLIDDGYHTVDDGEEVDKAKLKNLLASQLDAFRTWDFSVSLAVAPEPVSHPYGVLIHAVVQFDAVDRTDGSKDGHVERRVAIVRQDAAGAWKIAALPRVQR